MFCRPLRYHQRILRFNVKSVRILQWRSFSKTIFISATVGELLTCLYVLQPSFADQTYWQIFQFPILMNLQSVSKTTFQIVQREIVMPVLDHS